MLGQHDLPLNAVVEGSTDIAIRQRAVRPADRSIVLAGQPVGVYQSAEPSRLRQVFVQPFPATGAKYSVPAVEGNGTGNGHPFWNRKGSEIVINAAPTMSYSISFTAKPWWSSDDRRRSHESDAQSSTLRRDRRSVDAMPDGEHVIGVDVSGRRADRVRATNTADQPRAQLVRGGQAEEPVTSLERGVFGFRLREDRDVGVGVFPQREEILVGRPWLSRSHPTTRTPGPVADAPARRSDR